MPRVSGVMDFGLVRIVCHFLNFTFFGINIIIYYKFLTYLFIFLLCFLGKNFTSVNPNFYTHNAIRQISTLTLEINIRTEGLKWDTSTLQFFRADIDFKRERANLPYGV